MIVDALRETLYRAITTPRGDSLLPVRLPKDLARRANTMLGSPLCTREEAEKRRTARARLEALRAGTIASAPKAAREPATVMIYFEKDRNARELERMRQALDAKKMPYKLLDVAGDEATLDFVMREAKCEEDDLPMAFVAGKAIGGARAVIEADVSGALEEAVFGARRG